MNLSTCIVGIVVLAVVVGVVLYLRHQKHSGSGGCSCGGNCGSCGGSCCH